MWVTSSEGTYPAPTPGMHPLEMRSFLITMLLLWSMQMTFILMLLLARFWHARLDNEGGFGREFRSLRVPRWFAYVLILVIALRFVFDDEVGVYLDGVMQLGLMLCIFQGLAVTHAIVKAREGSVGWLVAMYATIVVSQFFLAIGGLIDILFDCRKRLGLA